MSDWEDEDYDPNAQLSAKLVELGLDPNKAKLSETGETTTASIARTKKAVASTANKNVVNPMEFRDLTEAEKREAQLASDNLARDNLFGIDNDDSDSQQDHISPAAMETYSTTSLKCKEDFIRFGDRLGAEISTQANNPYYLDLVNTLVDRITQPMKKIALESVEKTLHQHLDVFVKKEEEDRKQAEEERRQREQKKKKKKQLDEDLVRDEYDDFADKYY